MRKAVIAAVCCVLLGSAAGVQANGSAARNVPQKAATSKTTGDFNLPNRFSVEIDGVSVAGVHTIEGLDALVKQARSEQAATESRKPGQPMYKDGEDGTNRVRPGNHKPGKLTLTKDWSNTMEWFNWRKAVLDGKTDRRSISVIFHDDAGTEVGRMNFYNCWPIKHTLPSVESKSSGHASETIELAYEWYEWKGK
jgi:phage tail-like protein